MNTLLNLPKKVLSRAKNSLFPTPLNCQVPIQSIGEVNVTEIQKYWETHTVNSVPFKSAFESLAYLEWRFKEYPLFKEFMELYGVHENQVVLDYGCGPGNDLTGFLVHSKAKKVIGIDVSNHALKLASHRLSLHADANLERVDLIHVSDSSKPIPLPNECIDHLYCEGVLQHTSHPAAILKEFYRVLKGNSTALLMVYNKNSIWMHLYVAYQKLILDHAYPGMSAEEAFCKFTDGESCPLARCWDQTAFTDLCSQSGFSAHYVGGYLSTTELQQLHLHFFKAINDVRLPAKHRQFLRALTFDEKGYPMYQGKHAGIGGVYKLQKRT